MHIPFIFLELIRNIREFIFPKKTPKKLKFDEILPCTEELGEEFEEIKRKAEELTKREEELKCKVDKELDTLCKKIMDLQNKSGCKSENSSKIVATVLKSRMDNLEVVEKE
ncbi:hypothetical protein TNCV_3890711 [Trichonephila clavipes]|nr:hypothetical protein TNCV_3890711 [Trichonephila clavipes]